MLSRQQSQSINSMAFSDSQNPGPATFTVACATVLHRSAWPNETTSVAVTYPVPFYLTTVPAVPPASDVPFFQLSIISLNVSFRSVADDTSFLMPFFTDPLLEVLIPSSELRACISLRTRMLPDACLFVSVPVLLP